jgi:hypothetical protein
MNTVRRTTFSGNCLDKETKTPTPQTRWIVLLVRWCAKYHGGARFDFQRWS